MALKEYIPGSEMAGSLLERGANAVTQKGKDVVGWGVDKAIHGIMGGARIAMNVLGFALMAMPLFQFGTPTKKH